MNEEHLMDIPPTEAEIASDLLAAQADNLLSDILLIFDNGHMPDESDEWLKEWFA